MVTFEICHLAVPEILNYLSENDQIFLPALSTRLDINDFAVKLNNFAVHFCAHQNKELVGFSACYFNNKVTNIGYVSTFSVARKFQGKGVAKKLLTTIIEYAKKNGFKYIRLRVNVANLPAIIVYSDCGFIRVSQNTNQVEMGLNL